MPRAERFSMEQVRAAIQAANIKTKPAGYDVEMNSGYFYDQLRRIKREDAATTDHFERQKKARSCKESNNGDR